MLARRLLISVLLCLVLAPPADAAITRGWSQTGAMNVGRWFHGGVVLDDGRFLVAGGATANAPLASAEIYEPATGAWTFTGGMHEARSGLALVKLADGKVLAAGGTDGTNPLATAEVFDPATGLWTGVGPMTTPHVDAMSARLPDGRVLVAGGVNVGAGGTTTIADLYDPGSRTWTRVGAMPGNPRVDGAATVLTDGRVLVAGGYTGTTFSGDAGVFGGSWTGVGAMQYPRNFPGLAPLPGGRAIVAGGATAASEYSARVEIFDGSTWLPGPPLAVPHYAATTTVLGNGKVLIAGGYQTSSGGSTAELYDPVTNAWSPAGSMALGRWVHVSGRLPDGRVIVAGGATGDGSNNTRTPTTEIWTPTTTLVSDPAFAFGELRVGTAANAGVQVINTGDSPLITADFAIGGINPGDFSVNGDRCRVVAPGATCAIDVRFAPTALGARSASLTFSANTAGGVQAVPLSGRGTADSDGDGVLDGVDRCAQLKGSAARQGCPAGLLADPSIRYRSSKRSIRVLAYYVKATKGARVSVRCSRGCKRTVTKGKGSKRRVRITRLNNRRLTNGAKITVTVSLAGRLTTTVIDRVSRGRRIEGRPRCTPVGC